MTENSHGKEKRIFIVGPSIEPQDLESFRLALESRLEITSQDAFIGVDGGVSILQDWKLKPSLCVGDWDSLGKPPSADLPQLTLPLNKDRSDLFYALQASIGAGAQDIICLGVTGGRPDHHLASLFDLSLVSRNPRLKRVVAIGAEGEYHFVSQSKWETKRRVIFEENARVGQIVSILPMSPKAVLSLSGFEYSLTESEVFQNSQGLSNRIKLRNSSVHLLKGRVLIIIPHHGAAQESD